jgi:hypothetical protein
MKKFLLLALTAITALGLASCNRQEIDPPREGVQGKYLLTEITASTGDDDTKTNIQSNSVVVWNADDQIAVKGTDGALHYYKLKVGGGTPVGKFFPAPGQTPASYNTPADLTAIYPACAAELTDGELYVNINNQDLSGSFSERGLSSWNADSPFTFTNNDIKVAVPGSVKLEDGLPNFKFKQLGTCCSFIIDFTQADQARSLMMESVERIQISTLNGVALGGRAKLTGTTLGPITNPVTNIDWTVATPRPMSALIQPMFVFYPGVTTNTTLKITLTTTDHEFVFTGKPTQDFEAGRRLTFPVTVDKNFTQGGTLLAYTSTLRTDVDQFYYYGGTNCLLLRTPNEIGYLDVTQYVTDSFWHNTKNTADVQNPRPASYARIIWSEGADVIASATVNGSAYDYKLKMADSAAGATDAISTDSSGKSFLAIKRGSAAGNALVGIYDASDKLLWSYHIWCPEDDPTDGMYEYTQTNSGNYTVMTMPIGAIKKAYPGMSNPETAAGFYYQWGRKDPMGRPKNFNSLNGGGVLNLYGSDQISTLNLGDPDYSVSASNLLDCWIWFSNSNGSSEKNTLKLAWEGSDKSKTLGRFILDYTIAKPWMCIFCDDLAYSHSWLPLDDNLWGNGGGSNKFPIMEEIYKSIFDPSPEGFRVAPQDLFAGFTSTRQNSSIIEQFNVATGDYVNPNNANGWAFYYQGWKTGPTDFYLAQGQRSRAYSFLSNVSDNLAVWTSSPANQNNAGSMLYFVATVVHPYNAGGRRASCFSVRCVKEH